MKNLIQTIVALLEKVVARLLYKSTPMLATTTSTPETK